MNFLESVGLTAIGVVLLAIWWKVESTGRVRFRGRLGFLPYIVILMGLYYTVGSVINGVGSFFTTSPTSTPFHISTSTPNLSIAIPKPTKPPLIPTTVPLTYKGTPCISWSKINTSNIDSRLCVYGKVYQYGPNSKEWNFIQFSAEIDSFRVMDFNYYYYSPLNIGDCVLVYGKIRDYGSYLIITPDKDSTDSVKAGPSAFCE